MQPKMEKLYTVRKNKTGSYGSDHELLIAKFRLKLKKVLKTTRPVKCNLNQIPEWSSGFPYFLQFKSEFGNKEFMM